jgi:hypothetical protein
MTFDEFVAAKDAARADAARGRVTWRKAVLPGGDPGWSGIGVRGTAEIVYVLPTPLRPGATNHYDYGRIVRGRLVRVDREFLLRDAKAGAARLLTDRKEN